MANFTPGQIRQTLKGAVFPIPTPFDESGDIDLTSLADYVEFLASNDVGTILSTVGTSRFNLLDEDEIKTVNQQIAASSSKDTITILAGPQYGGLKQMVSFAEHAESVGADAFIACFPERWYDAEAVYTFFEQLAGSVSIGVMIHEMPMRSGYGGSVQYPLDLLERLVNIPNIVGMKEECMDGAHAYRLHKRLKGKCAIIGAGAMRNFLRDFHAGCEANLVGLGSFFPNVERKFHSAMQAGDLRLAHQIVEVYEDAYFDLAVQLGWHPQLKEVMNAFGLMQPYERAPLTRLDEDRKQRLDAFLESTGWLKLDPDHEPDFS